ncbi:MAG: nucleotidyltransferase domain-containing protein [Armatimonadota bacterium]|nr:nucleotidyltransferase domain-containing protein [Armatimonadota bacterium]
MKPLEVSDTVSPADKALLRDVKLAILRHQPKARILLYGSVARGTSTRDSDYDVLVITPHRLSTKEEDTIYDAVYEVELAQDAVVSVMLYSTQERSTPLVKASPYYKNIVKECLVV